MFKRKAILSVVILAAVLFLIHTATLSSTDLEANVPQSDPKVAPVWDTIGLIGCSGNCFGYGQYYYNICYACGCLKKAAESLGEEISAEAQCRAAFEIQ